MAPRMASHCAWTSLQCLDATPMLPVQKRIGSCHYKESAFFRVCAQHHVGNSTSDCYSGGVWMSQPQITTPELLGVKPEMGTIQSQGVRPPPPSSGYISPPHLSAHHPQQRSLMFETHNSLVPHGREGHGQSSNYERALLRLT